MLTTKIFFSRLRVDAHIGVLEHELHQTQPIYFDAELEVNLPGPINDLDVNTVLDYRKIRAVILEECNDKHVHLVEVLGQKILSRLMQDFSEISAIKLRISKPLAFADCEAVGIEFEEIRP